MPSPLQGEIDNADSRRARVVVAVVILAALTFADVALRVTGTSTAEQAHPPSEQPMPSACGSEAVARAQQELNRSSRPRVTALS